MDLRLSIIGIAILILDLLDEPSSDLLDEPSSGLLDEPSSSLLDKPSPSLLDKPFDGLFNAIFIIFCSCGLGFFFNLSKNVSDIYLIYKYIYIKCIYIYILNVYKSL